MFQCSPRLLGYSEANFTENRDRLAADKFQLKYEKVRICACEKTPRTKAIFLMTQKTNRIQIMMGKL